MVRMIAIFAEQYGGHTVEFHDDSFKVDATDEYWIGELGRRPDKWVALSADNRIIRNRAERAALREAGLNFFVFVPRWFTLPPNLMAAQLLKVWPVILSAAERAREPHVWEIPVSSLKLLDLGPTQKL